MADTLDLLTLEEGYRAVNDDASADAVNGGGSGGHDDEMAQWITGISRRIDDLCGPVVVRSISGELHDGGHHCIRPDETPVDSVTTLTEYRNTASTVLTAETNSTKPADGYLLDVESTHNVKIRRRSGNTDRTFPAGRRNIELDYDAGRYATTAAVDAKFKTAASAILRRFHSREASAWSRGGDPFAAPGTVGFFRAVDPMIEEFLGDEMKAVVVG